MKNCLNFKYQDYKKNIYYLFCRIPVKCKITKVTVPKSLLLYIFIYGLYTVQSRYK